MNGETYYNFYKDIAKNAKYNYYQCQKYFKMIPYSLHLIIGKERDKSMIGKTACPIRIHLTALL